MLYLTFDQFEDRRIPESLRDIAEVHPIFEIRNYVREIRSYRKLVPALRDFPDAVIITVDDDAAYHKHMIRDLLDLHALVPDAVLAHRVKHIKIGKPYRSWPKYRWYDFIFKKIHKSFLNLQAGVGGVLYPPHCLKPEMLDEELFLSIAPTTDDIWFWAAAALNGYPVVPVPFGRSKPRGLHKPIELSLKATNFRGQFDRNAWTLKEMMERFPAIEERIYSL